jgi:hypothetical protein
MPRNNRNNSSTTSRNRLSDRDMLSDMLLTAKSLSHLYDHAIMESSHDQVRDAFENMQQDEHEIIHTLFAVMQEAGWYKAGAGRRNWSARSEYSRGGSPDLAPPADSRYAVASGARQFGRQLGGDKRSGSRWSRSAPAEQFGSRPGRGF